VEEEEITDCGQQGVDTVENGEDEGEVMEAHSPFVFPECHHILPAPAAVRERGIHRLGGGSGSLLKQDIDVEEETESHQESKVEVEDKVKTLDEKHPVAKGQVIMPLQALYASSCSFHNHCRADLGVLDLLQLETQPAAVIHNCSRADYLIALLFLVTNNLRLPLYLALLILQVHKATALRALAGFPPRVPITD